MKKAIWILFVALALIWTVLAWAASGLARWTSDAIASDRMAQATQQVALKTEAVAQSVTKSLSDASGQLTERVATTMTQPVGDAVTGAVQQSVDAAKAAAASVPAMPPMPAWVNQLLGPEWTQSIKEWGAWAKAAAGASGTYVANAANAANAPNAPNAANASAQATPTTQATANQASSSAVSAATTTVTPWLASIVGWLVPLVWIIWGGVLILGFVITMIAQWLVGRFVSGSTT